MENSSRPDKALVGHKTSRNKVDVEQITDNHSITKTCKTSLNNNSDNNNGIDIIKTSLRFSPNSCSPSDSSQFTKESLSKCYQNEYTSDNVRNGYHVEEPQFDNVSRKNSEHEAKLSAHNSNNKLILSERKKKSLARLVASKTNIDKKFNPDSYHASQQYSSIEEENCLSTCHNNTSQGQRFQRTITDEYKQYDGKQQENEHEIANLGNSQIIKLDSSSNTKDHGTHPSRNSRQIVVARHSSLEHHESNKTTFSPQKIQRTYESLPGKVFIDLENNKFIHDSQSKRRSSYLEHKQSNHRSGKITCSMDANVNVEQKIHSDLCDIKNVVSQNSVVSQNNKGLPPIENMSQDTYSFSNKTYETSTVQNETVLDNNLSEKAKLFKIHSQDQTSLDNGNESSDEDEDFGGVYCGPKDSTSNKTKSKRSHASKVKKASTEDVPINKNSSGSEKNLSRNHSLKYSGGALHDDRNPLSFDHTFSSQQRHLNNLHSEQQRKRK